MMSSFLTELHRRINEHRACLNKAGVIHMQFLENPTKSLIREEIRCYKQAAELCGQIASLYDYSDIQCAEWLQKQGQHEQKLRELLDIHDNGLPNKTDVDDAIPTPKAAESKVANTGTQTKTGKGGARTSDSEISQETVDSWFKRGKDRPKHGFSAVVGMEEVKKKLQECVQDVASSQVNAYLEMGRVHSFFFYGPPGCGKTFITEAFVHELGEKYEYMYLTGADIHQSLVGTAEKVVKRAFEEAKKQPCILFIDEIDSVCRNRSQPNLPTHAMDTTAAFLNGYNSLTKSENPVIFIGATNYPDKVDGAMLDRVELIKVPLPDLKLRAHTFEMAFSRKSENGVEKLLDNEPGFSYADMAEETDNFSQRDCNRLVAMIKRAIKDDLNHIYKGDGDAMVAAMQNKQYLLKRQIFMDTLKNYHPSRKEEMIRNLDKWDDDFQKRFDE